MREYIIGIPEGNTESVINGEYIGEIVRCKDCKWGKETCGNIECFVDLNAPSEYHGYDWYCPNGEKVSE